MKILELSILETRGIRDLNLEPQGGSLLIWGPNGSGKSGIIDAVDFLMTGKMSRLMGPGTLGISLKTHGPHILAKSENAKVSAKIELTNGSEVQISRSLTDSILKMEAPNKSALQELSSFRRGQHMLTRRDLLHFIAAEAHVRAERMKELLDLSEIDAAWKGIDSARNQLTKTAAAAASHRDKVKARFAPIIESHETSPAAVLACANKARVVLGAEELVAIAEQKTLGARVDPPSDYSKEGRPTRKQLDQAVDLIIQEVGSARQVELGLKFTRLQELLGAFLTNPTLLKHFQRRELIVSGQALLDADGNCPLCDSEFAPDALAQHLTEVLNEIDQTDKRMQELATLRAEIIKTARLSEAAIEILQAALEKHMPDDSNVVLSSLISWRSGIDVLRNSLELPVESLDATQIDSLTLESLTSEDRIESANVAKEKLIASAVALTPEQQAWDTLTKLDEVLFQVRAAAESLAVEERGQRRAEMLADLFNKAQRVVLDSLYNSVKGRFVELYRSLHGSDESDFDAEIKPRAASLDLEVGFYDQGLHPPQALHSEGHQDSMGLCLFLALSEKLSTADSSPILLDDVVMSVDYGHRKKFAELLLTEFPDVQFVITTHDKTWARQLVSKGVIAKSNSHRITSWDLDSGPRTKFDESAWEKISKHLEDDEVELAAFVLRKSSEEFFQEVCNNLKARVRFSSDGEYDLGNVCVPAITELGRLIKKAKNVANSRKDSDLQAQIEQFHERVKQVVKESNAEQWAINASVHYNTWHTMERNDFAPVAEAFKQLFSLFVCDNCSASLHVVFDGTQEAFLACDCSAIEWSLN